MLSNCLRRQETCFIVLKTVPVGDGICLKKMRMKGSQLSSVKRNIAQCRLCIISVFVQFLSLHSFRLWIISVFVQFCLLLLALLCNCHFCITYVFALQLLSLRYWNYYLSINSVFTQFWSLRHWNYCTIVFLHKFRPCTIVVIALLELLNNYQFCINSVFAQFVSLCYWNYCIIVIFA